MSRQVAKGLLNCEQKECQVRNTSSPGRSAVRSEERVTASYRRVSVLLSLADAGSCKAAEGMENLVATLVE